jgi:hypothetical protein
MKKFVFTFLLLIGCETFQTTNPVFDHQTIKQIKIENPSFSLVVEKDQNDYYINELENAFIKNNIKLYFEDSQIIDSEAESKGVGIGFSGNKVGIGVARGEGRSTTKIQNTNTTNATCIYILNCYTWTFKVIHSETRELLMKGRIKYSFDREVASMVRELTGK